MSGPTNARSPRTPTLAGVGGSGELDQACGEATVTRSLSLDEETFLHLAEAARWAPSIHNSQPWRLRRLPDGLGVVEDLSRSLPVIDPQGRDRIISCGAALLDARLAMRALGWLPTVEVLPDPAEPTLIGVVRAVGTQPPTPADRILHRMIPLRRTHRRVYRSHVVAEEDLQELRGVVAAEGARLTVADPALRRRLAQLLRQAARGQAADDELRKEAERWVRREDDDGSHVDGVPVASLGGSPFALDSLVAGTKPTVPGTDEVEEELARSTVLAISTRDDDRSAWVVAGLALQRLLLAATAKGLVVGFADQALQEPAIRDEVAAVLDLWGRPQVLLRVGRALVEAPITPRRPLAQLLD
jgi:nitroreductase